MTMEFNSFDDDRFYNEHSQHAAFVENVWIPNVSEFPEIDYESY
ncbi:MAG: Dabb family protein [Lentisphaeraceae bacterium]|nr:Dabb family protein [Lentisphaeraceae bacterium]